QPRFYSTQATSSSGTSSFKRPCTKQKFVYNRPKPDVLQSILQSKANPQYNARRLWYELNMPECTSELLDGRMLSTTIPESLLCHTRDMRPKRKVAAKKKERRPSYMQMRLERENFRKKLVELIARKDDEDDVVDVDEQGGNANACAAAMELEADFPNKQEKEVLRYYYYIKHGIDTIHVSPMSKK
uniref:Uncharacterized protein n=1 Tax=Stomoxys calcitrans TaxID=35570 RepID=A0A1I8NRQ4_STOCA